MQQQRVQQSRQRDHGRAEYLIAKVRRAVRNTEMVAGVTAS